MPTIGDHIGRIRRERALTQEQLAERAGISVETIGKLERNERTSARMSTLAAVARALGVPTSGLIGDASAAAARAEPDHRPLSLMPVRRALMPVTALPGTPVPPTVDGTGEPPGLDQLRATLRGVDQAYHRNDYATALATLPALIVNARAAVTASDEAERSRAHALVARTCHLTGNLLIQLRAGDLAYLALTSALEAADAAGDPVTGAAVLQGMNWLLLRQGRFGEAEALAIRSADRLEPRFSRAQPDELAAWGWLLMVGAAAAARDNRPDDALEMIDAAAAAAVRIGGRPLVGDHLMMMSGFDAKRVEIQRVETAAVAGEPGQVLDLAGRMPGGPGTVSSCWQRHRLDVAWAHAQLGRWTDATDVLIDLRERAPAWLRQQRYARDIVTTITTGRRRVMGRELADLAALVGAATP